MTTRYALIENGAIIKVTTNPRIGLLTYATVPELQALGWQEVVENTRPDNTPTSTFEQSLEVVAGVPTVVWTERPWTQAELDAIAVAADLEQKAMNVDGAVAAMRAAAVQERAWSQAAGNVTVSGANAVATLQAVVDTLAEHYGTQSQFYDWMADLIESKL